MPSQNMFYDEDEAKLKMLSAKDHLRNIKNKYYQLCEQKELTVTQIYQSVDPYFNVADFTKKSTQKRIFNICFAPLKQLSKYHNFKKYFIKFIAAGMYRYIEQDYDFIMAITGTEGTGKSATSLYLAQQLVELGMTFDMDKDIFFRGDATPSGFGKAWASISDQRKHVIIFDEGKAFFDKRQSMNSIRVESLQELTSQRSKNHIILINVGDIQEIDVYFRDRRCRCVLMLPDRGLGFNLFNKGVIGMGDDRFNLEWFNRMITFSRNIDPLAQIEMISSLPTQYGMGVIPHVDVELYNKYVEFKDKRNSVLDKKRLGLMKKKIKDEEKATLKLQDEIDGVTHTPTKELSRKAKRRQSSLFQEEHSSDADETDDKVLDNDNE
jgi:hypothetical protein